MSDEELKAMVDAFLAWPLPNDVAADAIACQPGALHRTGTNLLTAAQTRAMFEHCLAVVRAHDRDGGRYRWLCANPLWPDAVCVAMSDGDKPALDAAIGAAMREDGE